MHFQDYDCLLTGLFRAVISQDTMEVNQAFFVVKINGSITSVLREFRLHLEFKEKGSEISLINPLGWFAGLTCKILAFLSSHGLQRTAWIQKGFVQLRFEEIQRLNKGFFSSSNLSYLNNGSLMRQ